MVRRMGLLLFMLLLLAGCNGEGGPTAQWLLRAGYGQTVTLPGTSLAITFDGIPEDSRCPADVACAWSGQVTVELTIDDDAGDPQAVAFTVFTDGRGRVTGSAQNAVAETTYGDYRIVLRKVDPYPEHHDKAVPVETFGVTLEVGPRELATPEIVTPEATPDVVTPEAPTPTPGSRSGSPPPPRGTPTPTPEGTPVTDNACPDARVLPVLCISYQILAETAAGVAEGEPVQLGAETDICEITSQADGDAICRELGDGWMMADTGLLDPSSAWSEFIAVDQPAWSWDWDTGAPVAR